MEKNYKTYHADQMHSTGTTPYETMSVILPSFFYVFFTVTITSYIPIHFTKQNSVRKYLSEFICLILPIVFNITVLSNYASFILIILIAILIGYVLLEIFLKRGTVIKPTIVINNTDFVTNARSTINVLSVLAILAVDFKVFPRRFAKTETFGHSLMDAGVGLYVFSNGIVAPEVRGVKDSIKTSFKKSVPLFIIGIARSVFTKQTDYNVPVSEYGVHWNFFVTLAVTKIFTSFFLNVYKIKYIYINAILLLVSHEMLLQAGLQKFVLMDTKRDNFITANKEGIVSTMGYVSIYLFSVYFGYSLDFKKNNQKKLSKRRIQLKLAAFSVSMLFFSLLFQHYFGISRRLANASYCCWILFIGVFMTGLYYAGQILYELVFYKNPKASYSPFIFQAANYNGLIFFLVGNVITGLINLNINTLLVNNAVGLSIIVIYMFVNCLVVCVLYCKQIKVKL